MDLLDACSFHLLSLQAEGRSPQTTRLYRPGLSADERRALLRELKRGVA